VSDAAPYTPPKVWKWDSESGGRFAKINRPIAGPTHEKELPVGRHPLQLYSLATPNGVKVTVMLEELLALGRNAEYDAWLIDIGEGAQFGSGFVAVNPNSKIPALLDRGTSPPTRVFESGAIVFYLAEKFDAFSTNYVVSGDTSTSFVTSCGCRSGTCTFRGWRRSTPTAIRSMKCGASSCKAARAKSSIGPSTIPPSAKGRIAINPPRRPSIAACRRASSTCTR
jgi:hypothetical protein